MVADDNEILKQLNVHCIISDLKYMLVGWRFGFYSNVKYT